MPIPDNQSEDKHVESRLVPRLDESSNLSSSTETSVTLISSGGLLLWKLLNVSIFGFKMEKFTQDSSLIDASLDEKKFMTKDNSGFLISYVFTYYRVT